MLEKPREGVQPINSHCFCRQSGQFERNMVPEDAPKTGTEQNETPIPAYAGRRSRRSGRGRRGRGRRPSPLETDGQPLASGEPPLGRPDRHEEEEFADHGETSLPGTSDPAYREERSGPEAEIPYHPADDSEALEEHAPVDEPEAEYEGEPAPERVEAGEPEPSDVLSRTEAGGPARTEADDLDEPEPRRASEPQSRPARPSYRAPQPERRTSPPEPPSRPLQPASPEAVRKAIEEVGEVLESLRLAIDDLEEVLDTLELAERQKTADEREIESLRRALRQFQRPREREGRERDGRDREGGPRR